ncbi:cytochrome P450 [Streptomyces sp. NBC_01304]|uniref:cytochrome P450 n=1 Tax=Streptomyces sp. NBC_01304 TaxID=2903818 RepID=UPI002E147BC0|nr:cytochrome P450 [Streptomyces sp. NBC_01304]
MSGSRTAQRVVIPDLSDPALYRAGEQYGIWARLREQAPVCRVERPGERPFWAVLAYEHVNACLADAATFSSARGMRLDADPVATNAATGKMMVVTDPPQHGKIRRIVSSAFTPKMVRRLEDNMRLTAVDVIETALAAGDVNFAEVAARLPVSVICDMLGVPREDWDFMLERTKIAFSDTPDADKNEIAAAHTDIFLYYDELMRERRKQPQDDIISALVHGTIDGRPLTVEEIILNCNNLVSGGNETTRHSTIQGLLAFIENPDQWHRLRDDLELLPSAVREILRYTTPAMHVLRTTTREVEVGGQLIGADEMVTLWLASANRDEKVFADPDRFDIERNPTRHLTYAYGAHFCIGAALASTELNIFFEELLLRAELAELTGEVQRVRSNLIGGIDRMPVRLTRRAGAGASGVRP